MHRLEHEREERFHAHERREEGALARYHGRQTACQAQGAGRGQGPQAHDGKRNPRHGQEETRPRTLHPDAGEQESGAYRQERGAAQPAARRARTGPLDHARERAHGERHDYEQQWQDPPEDVAPVKRLGDDAGDGRAQQGRHDPGAGGERHHPGTGGIWVRAVDGRVHDGAQRPAAQTLQHPTDDEHEHRLGRPAHCQPDAEQGEADDQGPGQ